MLPEWNNPAFRDRSPPGTGQMDSGMTALPQDVVAELKARISELEQRLQTSGAENAQLARALALSRDGQQASAEILGTIADAPGDAKRALYQIAETSARLFGAPSSTIQVAEGHGWAETIRFGDISKRIGAGVPDSRLRIGGSNMPGLIVAENRQVHVPDLDNVDPAIAHWPGLPFARAGGTRSMSGSPLRREGKAIGALIIYRDRLQPFTDDEMALQQIFADQAAIAIENARLFNETKDALERQTATAEVLQVISRSAFDLGAVLQTVVEIAAKLCRADAAQIYQREGEFYRSAVMCGKVNDSYRKIEQTGVISASRDTLIGRVALQAQPIQIADAWTDPEYGAGEDARIGNLRSMLGVPLMRNGKLIGAFALAREKVEAFADGEVELVKTFADQAVIAIENARLFGQVQARTRELAASLDDLRAAQDRLIQTEKLASLGQLTAGIAHEIKNPLNFVNNFASLSAELTDELNEALASSALADKTRAEVDELTRLLKDNLQKVVQHGKRADSIVKNMLLHSREGSGEHRPTDINALVEESLNLAYHGARAEKPQFTVTIKRELDPGAGIAELFPQEITRVLLNLISNGFYAVTKRRAESGAAGYEPVLVAATRDRGDHVEIRIRDNGTGIPEDVKQKMFNPFFTTKPAGEGTGLGLSMSHDIVVKQHAGAIDVHTLSGEFTEFTIRLPRRSAFPDKTNSPDKIRG